MRRSGSEEIGSPSRVSITGAGGFSLPLSRTKERPISLVNSRAEALGYKARRSPGRFCRGAPNGFFGRDTRFCLLGQVSYPAIFMRRSPNLKTRPGNSVRPSGGKNVTHYTKTLFDLLHIRAILLVQMREIHFTRFNGIKRTICAERRKHEHALGAP